MKKIHCLFKKDPENLALATKEIDPDNTWVFTDGIATRKYDGLSTAIINGEIYKRYDAKLGRVAPEGAIPCQEADEMTGHHPHWVRCRRGDRVDKLFFEAFDKWDAIEDGTYELCGEKIGTRGGVNAEQIKGHVLIRHGDTVLPIDLSIASYVSFRDYLSNPANDIEGIVFHHRSDGRLCKLKKSDFGIKRVTIRLAGQSKLTYCEVVLGDESSLSVLSSK